MSRESNSVQRRINEFWRTIGPEYEDREGNVPPEGSDQYLAWTGAVRAALPADACDVLDVGTGTGFAAHIPASLGHLVTGLDLAIGMITVAHSRAKRHERLRFVVGDAVEPPFVNESFDVVLSRHLLWTLREPETALGNWLLLLRPGGRIVAFDALDAIPLEPDKPASEPGDAATSFERCYTWETRRLLPVMALESIEPLIAMFDSAGFTQIRATRSRGLDYPPSEKADEQLPFVVTGFRPRRPTAASHDGAP